jgi:hypothetical protein
MACRLAGLLDPAQVGRGVPRVEPHRDDEFFSHLRSLCSLKFSVFSFQCSVK